MKKRICLFLCVALILSVSVLPVSAGSEPSAENVMNGILSQALERSGAANIQEWLDTGLTEGAGKGSEWYVFALLEMGEDLDYSRFAAALQDYVDERDVTNAVSRERIGLAFHAMGYVSPYTEMAANSSIGELGLMSYVFGLHLSNNGVKCSINSEEIVSAILDLQMEDGGWAISGTKGDPDTTGMVLQALAPHRDVPAAADAIERGLDYLQSAQLENGAFRSFGQECPESICQVIVALCTLGIDPLSEEYTKNGITLFDALFAYRMEDGTFRHTMDTDSNNMSTMEVLYTLASYESYLRGGKSFYEFDVPGKDISEAREKTAGSATDDNPSDKGTDTLEENVKSSEQDSGKKPLLSAKKRILTIIVAVLAIAGCLYFFLSGRRNIKNFLFVLFAAALLLVLIFNVRIEKTEDYYGEAASNDETIATTITIRCDTVKGRQEHIPADGIVLDTVEIRLPEGGTAYDQLVKACRNYTIHMDKEESAFSSAYVKGLANIYEFDFGDLSGWMYCVNGQYANVGTGEYQLHDGDSVEWHYTLELGRDIGDSYYMEESD